MAVTSTTDLLAEALALHRRGDGTGAAARYAEVLRVAPDNADANYYLGLISCQHGRFAEGAELARKSLAKDPRHARAHVLFGRALCALGRPGEALAYFDQAIALAPDFAQAHGHRGDVLSELGRNAEAIESYDRALALAPDLIEDRFNRGAALFAVGRYDDAIASFDRVLAGKPEFADASLWRAKVLLELHRHDEALESVDKLIAKDPELAEAWVGRGNVLTEQKRTQDAFAAFDKALTLRPDTAEAWLGRGNLLSDLKRNDDALTAYDRALTLKPDLAEAWLGRGNLFTRLMRYQEAFGALDRAFQLNPDFRYLAGQRIHVKQHLCDWTDLDAEIAKLLAAIRAGKSASIPFSLLALPSSAADQLQCAERYIQDQESFPAIWRGEVYPHDRIRVAYLSADFREHATAYLTAGLFEHHDKSRFETTALSFGSDPESPTRHRIEGAFEHFLDVQQQTDVSIADLIRRHEIDIAIDLMGITANSRPGILARRPAPIQVNYLAFPGTMGAKYIDYIIADPTIIPEDQCAFYTEQVVWLPDSYQINDNRRRVSVTPTRGECGLPDGAFVFCSFNNAYKTTPQVFDIWMRLLKNTKNSVLWLLDANTAVSANLRREAEKRGVAPERLIFAGITAAADHLARHRLADLFLDTLPYNAHTTASDSLWAGVPVLTCSGATFAARVAGSLLKAVGLDELITQSLEDYEALALKLAHDPAYLSSLKERLVRNRNSFPLFNTERTTRQIEAAYTMMWQRYQGGKRAKAGSADRENC